MTQDEELQTLLEENRILKALVAQLLPLQEHLAQAQARIKELEERLAQDSHPSGKRPGGQAGHLGHTLSLVEQPDEVVRHRPQVCCPCWQDLT